MPQRTVISGGVLVTDSEEIRADLVIDDHTVVAMLDDATGVDTDEQIDARDLLVLPAGVDMHGPVPDGSARARTLGDQRSAAAGGIGTLVSESWDAPDDAGTVTTQAADFAYWHPISGGHLPSAEQLSRMAQTGIAGFTASMRGNGPPEQALTDAELLAVMKMLSRLTVPLAITPLHAEIAVTDPLAELTAASTALLFAEHTGAWLHLRHVTTAATMQKVVEARSRGARVTVSVPALHLALPAGDATRLLRPLPPLRSEDEIDALWAFVLDEQVDCITSIDIRRKGRDGGPVRDIQTALPLFWDEAVTRRKMSRTQAARMLSTNAAQITGVHPRKGTIRIGSDADLVLLDPFGAWTVRSRDMLNEDRWSPLDDRELTGFVVRTVRRGQVIYDADRHDDESLLQEGSGVLLARA